jgi:outer membrane protein OmpA-like peptidoglycan-associated protein
MHTKHLIAFAVAGALLGACASTPPHDDHIDQAQAAIQTLSADPLAQQAAARDLDEARARLQNAQDALATHQPIEVVDHLAYLAQRHAEAGLARVHAERARADLAQAQQQRTQILLAARAREAQNAQDQVQATRAQVVATRAELAQAQQELAELKAKPTDRGMVVTLGDVLFDTGQASLKPGADLALDRLASYLKAHPQTKIVVEGHTDSVGSDEYNDALSQRRADAVAHGLITRGVDGDDVRAVGRGKNFPVATNDTSAGRQQNRRVEIVFSDENGRFAQGEDVPAQR